MPGRHYALLVLVDKDGDDSAQVRAFCSKGSATRWIGRVHRNMVTNETPHVVELVSSSSKRVGLEDLRHRIEPVREQVNNPRSYLVEDTFTLRR